MQSAASLEKVIRRSDNVIFGALCGMIFFVPISSALVEWMFGIAIVAYGIKRGAGYRAARMQSDSSSGKLGLKDKVGLLLKHFKPVQNVLNKPVAVFLTIMFLSACVSYYPFLAFKAFVFKTLQVIFTMFFFIEAFVSSKRIKIFTGIYVASIALIVTNGWFQYFTMEGFIRKRIIYEGRVLSSFHHANDFASFLMIAIPFLIALSLIQYLNIKKSTVDSTQEKGADQVQASGVFHQSWFMMSSFILLIVSVLALGLTYSRGGWLACGISLFILFIKRPKILTIYVLLGLIFLSVFVIKMVNERTTNIRGSYKNVLVNFSDRGGNWKNASGIILDHPFLGVGPNNYTELAHQYQFRRAEYPHNCFLQMGAEVGLLGLGAFCWILFELFRSCIQHLKRIKDPFAHLALLGITVGLGGFLIQSFFDTNFYSTQLSSYMWLMMGYVIAIPRIATNTTNPS